MLETANSTDHLWEFVQLIALFNLQFNNNL